MASEVLTPEELKITQTGTSHAGPHCLSSASTYDPIGNAFVDATIDLGKAPSAVAAL